MGWHCEGTPLRSIFGLMMWSEIFPTDGDSDDKDDDDADADADDDEEDSGKVAAPHPCFWPGGAVPAVPDVFQTAYQDAPKTR